MDLPDAAQTGLKRPPAPAVPRWGRGGLLRLLQNKHSFVLGGMEGMKHREFVLQPEPGDGEERPVKA